MEYKDTLLMGKTEFEMRGKLNTKDPFYISKNKNEKLYDKLSTRDGKEFILHDGPPYANGDIHIGHALNKIVKDFIVRDAVLNGKRIDWRVGWDAHGLPIELKVQQSGIKLTEVGKEEYLKECYKYAYEQVEKQQFQFEKLAILTDFNQKYITIQKDFEARQISVFNTMLNKGLVYQDLKPVYWSWSSETALAEAEIEYKNVNDMSIYVKFALENKNFLIWTTTPWTLLANVAIAFGKNIDYVEADIEGEKVIIAENLVNKLSEDIKKEIKVISKFDVKTYIGGKATNPLNGNEATLVWGHHVTTESGTGLVHIAGGHGQDDYIIVKENDLPLVIVQDDKGHMINAGEFDGIFYLKANKLIVNKLIEESTVIAKKVINHSIAIDWRTKEPVVYRATKQWFVSIEPIKKELIKSIKNVKWFPSWGEERLIRMTENRNDWCISRQRLWGVPIPIIYDEDKKPIIDKGLQQNIVKAIEEHGIMAWHEIEIKDLLPENIEFKKGMSKETDILDVWFDSGTSFKLLGGKTSDVYLEGNDQYRGWFNSSLINSYIENGKAPYKNVITHGMVLDGKGNKMSKSIGNTVDPIEITDKFGADILRLWAASSDYKDNVRISDDAIKQVSKDYMSIRNTIKFLLSHLSDWNNEEIEIKNTEKMVLNELSILNNKIKESYKEFNFINVIKDINEAISSNGVIGWFNTYNKDILYTHGKNSSTRKSVQYVVNKIYKLLAFSLAPIIPVTIDESWTKYGNNNSIFEETYPTFDSYESLSFESFKDVKAVVYKAYEELRNKNKDITSTEMISVNLSLPKELDLFKEDILRMLLVAEVIVIEGELSAYVKAFEGNKCPRCWKYFKVEKLKGEICEVCHNVIETEYK